MLSAGRSPTAVSQLKATAFLVSENWGARSAAKCPSPVRSTRGRFLSGHRHEHSLGQLVHPELAEHIHRLGGRVLAVSANV